MQWTQTTHGPAGRRDQAAAAVCGPATTRTSAEQPWARSTSSSASYRRRRRGFPLQPGRPGTAVGKERVPHGYLKPSRRKRAGGLGGGDPGATPEATELLAEPGHPHGGHRRDRRLAFSSATGSVTSSAASTSRWRSPPIDNDFAISVLGFSFLIVGWLIGLKASSTTWGGRCSAAPSAAGTTTAANVGFGRNDFRYTLDHKVVGLQYGWSACWSNLLHWRPAGDRDQDRAAVSCRRTTS